MAHNNPSDKYLNVVCSSLYDMDATSGEVKATTVFELTDQDGVPTTPVYGSAVEKFFTCGAVPVENDEPVIKGELIQGDSQRVQLYQPVTKGLTKRISHPSIFSLGPPVTSVVDGDYYLHNDNQIMPVSMEADILLYFGCLCELDNGRVTILTDLNVEDAVSVSPDMNIYRILAMIDKQMHPESYND